MEDDEGTFTCETLADGTVVAVYWVAEGMSDGNHRGATAMAIVDGPTRSLQLTYESFDRDTALTADTIAAIAEDPLVAWTTSRREQRGRRAYRGVPGARPRGPRRQGGVRRVGSRRPARLVTTLSG